MTNKELVDHYTYESIEEILDTFAPEAHGVRWSFTIGVRDGVEQFGFLDVQLLIDDDEVDAEVYLDDTEYDDFFISLSHSIPPEEMYRTQTVEWKRS